MPFTSTPIPHDAKWRYFWAIGERSESDRKYEPPKLVPDDIPGTINIYIKTKILSQKLIIVYDIITTFTA